jgi:hypothetical protein
MILRVLVLMVAGGESECRILLSRRFGLKKDKSTENDIRSF